MTEFIKQPNLPTNKIKSAIISNENYELVKYIESLEIELLFTEANRSIDNRIACHSDINAHHLGGGKIILDGSQNNLAEQLRRAGMTTLLCDKAVCGKYPTDCRLNFTRLGDRLFGKAEICDETLKKYCLAKSIDIANVRQGYCKCSVCVVNNNAAITDDESVKLVFDNYAIDCLLISKGDIRLDGHKYGFIGGTSALIDKDKLLFFGDIKVHRDYERIKAFLSKHNCEFVYSRKIPLTDVGGMIALTQEM